LRLKPFGRTGVAVPAIGQGTWYMERDGRPNAVAALRAGLDLGMSHIDTAEMYGSGLVEEIVGEAIAGRRENVFLVSKVLPQHASFEGVLRACEGSLGRLRTERLDVYLLHWRGSHPLEQTIGGFERLVRDGKIRFWGVSNFDVEDLEAALAIAGEGRMACNQVLYHLEERAIEHEVIPWCREHGVAIVGYSPFGSGRFPSATSGGGRALAEIARARRITPRQVALAFLVREDTVFAIPKSSSVEHVRENAAAGDVELSAEEVEQIVNAFPLGRQPRTLPAL